MSIRLTNADYMKLTPELQERINKAVQAEKAAIGTVDMLKRRKELVMLTTKAAMQLQKPVVCEVQPKAGKRQKAVASPADELAKAQRKAEREKLEMRTVQLLQVHGLWHLFVRGYQFHPTRKWKFDFYSARYKLALEIHGSVHSGGRHTRGYGFTEDRVKMNTAAIGGIFTLEFTAEHLKDGTAIQQIQQFLAERGYEDVQRKGFAGS